MATNQRDELVKMIDQDLWEAETLGKLLFWVHSYPEDERNIDSDTVDALAIFLEERIVRVREHWNKFSNFPAPFPNQ